MEPCFSAFFSYLFFIQLWRSLLYLFSLADLYNVKTAVFTIAVNWKQLGLALGLASHTVERIEKDHIKSGVGDCLDAALTEWLKGAYDTKRFGPPSWAQLVAAVRSEAWVNNPALASEIATKYNGTI